MMGVLIKGIEMPKSGDLTIVITSSGYVEDLSGNVIESVEAVSVPTPHGRCIDVDALDSSETDYLGNHIVYLVDIDDASTIIPAEEGE